MEAAERFIEAKSDGTEFQKLKTTDFTDFADYEEDKNLRNSVALSIHCNCTNGAIDGIPELLTMNSM